MIRHLYLLIFLLPVANGLRAQCTTDAGTLTNTTQVQLCQGEAIEVTSSGDAILDGDDVLVYMAYAGADPVNGTLLAVSFDGNFPFNTNLLDFSPIYVAAIAGNNDGAGSVNLSDPCLSVSQPKTITFFDPVLVTVDDGLLTCINTTTTIVCSTNGPGSSFSWSGPGAFTSTTQNPTVTFPGQYCVTVTNNSGCTGVACAVVVFDTSIPLVSLDPTYPMPCPGPALIEANISGCSFCTIEWIGPGIINGQGTEAITVDQLGAFQLIVTNQDNGCTASALTVVVPENVIPSGNFTATNASCFNIADGAVTLNTLPAGTPPFTFAWLGTGSFSSTEQNISGLLPGVYTLTATDVTGCGYQGSVLVSSPQGISMPPNAQFFTDPMCFGEATGAFNITATGGTPPLTYAWSGPNGFTSTQEDLTGLVAGTYTVIVTDAIGCSLTPPAPFVLNQPDQLIVDVGPVNCSENSLFAMVTGGEPPYLFQWNDGNTTAVITDLIPGLYRVTIVDAFGCDAIGIYNYTGSTNNLCGAIEGRLVLDTIQNCLSDALEPGLAGWIVKAVDGSDTYYGVSNASGFYKILVEEGNYTLLVEAPNDQLWLVCTPSVAIGQVSPDDTVTVPDVPLQEILECPLMEVSISTNFLRRCFDNNFYYVNYCNIGTADATDASIVVTLDPFLSIVNAEFAYTSLGNDQYLFELGDVAVGACDNIWIRVMISCDALLGQTHCVEVLADPAGECLPNDPLWSGASLSLRSECSPDSVFFIIKNTGIGNMSADAEYIVIEDAVMRAMGTDLRLDSGDSMRISVPANGATWRVEVTQEPMHPGASQPMLSVEGCSSTGAFTTGFVSQFSSDDDDPWIDIDCRPNIGAYDPNDKQGFPIGYGAQRYIRPGTDIEYLIRFQNTGTDTAFNVYVLDTLSAWLDPASVRLGASSHPFVFDIYGNGILKFDFPNIMLPDSNVNEPLSNGFVQFRIAHREDAPLETVIENRAAIYFDFNEPVITNTTEHRLGENFISVKSWEVLRPGLKLDVAPNPSFDVARVTVNGLKGGEDLRLRICDLQGRTVRELPGSRGVFEIQRGAMPAGVYQLVLFVDGQVAGSGKMVVN